MTSEEKEVATARRLDDPPKCFCGDRAMVEQTRGLEFVCPNKHPVSHFS